MRFKNFEIRECGFQKYEVVQWRIDSNYKEYCYTVAFIEYNYEDMCFGFRSLGTRYLENREDGLEEYILKYIELLDISKRYTEKEYDD